MSRETALFLVTEATVHAQRRVRGFFLSVYALLSPPPLSHVSYELCQTPRK